MRGLLCLVGLFVFGDCLLDRCFANWVFLINGMLIYWCFVCLHSACWVYFAVWVVGGFAIYGFWVWCLITFWFAVGLMLFEFACLLFMVFCIVWMCFGFMFTLLVCVFVGVDWDNCFVWADFSLCVVVVCWIAVFGCFSRLRFALVIWLLVMFVVFAWFGGYFKMGVDASFWS